MNKPLQKLRRFFARPKKFNATANPDALSAAYDDDDGASRLSGAFVVVLLLHIVALVGVFAFAKIKDSRAAKATSPALTETVDAPKSTPAASPKTPAGKPAATTAAATAPVTPPSATVGAQNVTAAALTQSEPKLPTTDSARTAPKGTYTVKAGDNLTKIANNHHVTIADLAKANGLKIDGELRPGQELKIPEPMKAVVKATPAPEPAAPGTYIVRRNDSLIKIASNLGVKYEDLVKLNNIKDPKKLQEGQKLKVPKKG